MDITQAPTSLDEQNVIEAEKKECKEYLARFDKLKAKRGITENSWQTVMTYILPRKEDVITVRQPGDRRGHDLFDSTAILANNNLASGLHSMLTNPSTRFFDLTTGNRELDANEEVKTWLQETADTMFTVINTSNFQTEVHEIYLDLGSIGTACLYVGEHEERLVHFNARAMKEIYADEDNLGMIDTIFRTFDWTSRQCIQEFGESKVPKAILSRYKNNDDTPWKILHATHPMSDEMKGSEKNKLLKFGHRSIYILMDELRKLSDSGFHEFPYAAPRWTKTTGEIYGRSPGMDALPDVQMVNKMQESVIKGAQKAVDPPLQVPDDGIIGRVRLTPGGLTTVRAGAEAIKPLIGDTRVDFGFQAVENIRKQIKSAFFYELLQLVQGPQMTATETAQRASENLRLMGPVLSRQHFEFLAPVVHRVFGILSRKKKIKPAPQIIQGKMFFAQYSSVLARAQRMAESENIARAIGMVAPLVNVAPDIMDNLDTDKTFREIMDIQGVPHRLMKSDRDIKKIRDAKAQAQAKMVQQQDQAHQAEVAGKTMPGIAQLQQAQTQAQQGPGGGQ